MALVGVAVLLVIAGNIAYYGIFKSMKYFMAGERRGFQVYSFVCLLNFILTIAVIAFIFVMNSVSYENKVQGKGFWFLVVFLVEWLVLPMITKAGSPSYTFEEVGAAHLFQGVLVSLFLFYGFCWL